MRQAIIRVLDFRRIAWPWLCVIIGVALLVITPMLLYEAKPTLDWVNFPANVATSPELTSQAFAIGFWPSLYSGIIAGAITGLLIGIALFFAQIRVAAIQHRQAQADAIAGFFGTIEIYALASNRGDYVTNRAVEAAPLGAEQIVDEMKGKPLKEWWDMFPEHLEGLAHLELIRRAHFDFQRASRIIDTAFEIAAREYLQTGPYPSSELEVDAVRRYSLGRVLGIEEQLLVARSPRTLNSSLLEAGYQFTTLQPHYDAIVGNYLRLIHVTQESMNALVAGVPKVSITDEWGDEAPDDESLKSSA